MRSGYIMRIDGLALVAVAIMALMGFSLAAGSGLTRVEAASQPTQAALPTETPRLIQPPYEHYIVTQGPHGQTYGHLAIDLTAGKGAEILSPIDGVITANFRDELGNTTLVIENQRFQVTLLHGDYLVQVGDQVHGGQVVGYESNHGFTVDAQGIPCWGRNCGYHTHLNLFDKSIGDNVNPLELWEP